jgi:hypothetical protein
MSTSQREPPEDNDIVEKKLDSLIERADALIASNEKFIEQLDTCK